MLPYPVKPTDEPCTRCGKPIQPGQLYLPTPEGPRHLGCSLVCYFCKGVIEVDKAIQAKTKNAWAHFSCWYDGTPVKGIDGRVF